MLQPQALPTHPSVLLSLQHRWQACGNLRLSPHLLLTSLHPHGASSANSLARPIPSWHLLLKGPELAHHPSEQFDWGLSLPFSASQGSTGFLVSQGDGVLLGLHEVIYQ